MNSSASYEEINTVWRVKYGNKTSRGRKKVSTFYTENEARAFFMEKQIAGLGADVFQEEKKVIITVRKLTK